MLCIAIKMIDLLNLNIYFSDFIGDANNTILMLNTADIKSCT